MADYAGKRFVPGGAAEADVVNAGAETGRPPSLALLGLGAQEVAELVQMVAATKLENERLRAAAIPRLARQQLERLIVESLPYQWMQTLAVAVKAFSATDANWDAHELAKAIWTVVHEDLMNKRQGRTSHMPIPQGTGVQTPGIAGAPIGGVVRAPGGQAIVGAPRGVGGHNATRADSLDTGHDSAPSGGHGHGASAARSGQDIPGVELYMD